MNDKPLLDREDIVGLVGERVNDDAWAERSMEAIERAAAAKALTDAAHQFATQDGLEVLMFARNDVAAVRVTEKWLIDRAAALGLTAGQEGEKDE